jgi:hypothetical protein
MMQAKTCIGEGSSAFSLRSAVGWGDAMVDVLKNLAWDDFRLVKAIADAKLDFATFAFRGAGTLRAVQAARAKIPTS